TVGSLWWSCRHLLAVCTKTLHSHLPGPDINLYPYGALFLIRVYALYGRSRRVLGLLLMLGLGSLIHAAVCLFPPELQVFVHISHHSFAKLMMAAGLHSRGDTVLAVPSLH
ncbi:hypothetical protein BJV78DRAFT_1250798, partial [Lactifluus subvellereus]